MAGLLSQMNGNDKKAVIKFHKDLAQVLNYEADNDEGEECENCNL